MKTTTSLCAATGPGYRRRQRHSSWPLRKWSLLRNILTLVWQSCRATIILRTRLVAVPPPCASSLLLLALSLLAVHPLIIVFASSVPPLPRLGLLLAVPRLCRFLGVPFSCVSSVHLLASYNLTVLRRCAS